jgi:hypothetical protein
MTERRPDRHPDGPHGAGHEGYTPDRDINIRAVVGSGLALVLATALGMAVSWWLAVGLRGHLEEEDPRPPTLIEAQMPYEPPSPNLQIAPADELAAARAEEAQLLGSWEWADAARSKARVPIERGMELLLQTRPGAEAFDAPAPRAPMATPAPPDQGSGEATPDQEETDGV